jgi:transposase
VIEPGAPLVHESLFGRPAQEDPSSRGLGEAQGRPKSEAARTFGVSRSCVKLYAATRREGRPLSPRKHPKHPGSEPKLDERARKILQADVVEARPATTLKDRCRFLQEALGVWVSESTLSRLLRKMGFSPKDGACSRACSRARTRRVLEGRLARPGLRQAGWEALRVRGRVLLEHLVLEHLALADLRLVAQGKEGVLPDAA